jgi:lactate 2-monooxygenase
MSTTQKPVANPVEYEKSVYQNGLRYERPPFTFRSTEWESQASMVMSATSKGYVVGNAGTGETAQKNVDAFKKWSIVPSRLVKSEGLPDLSTKIFDQKLQFPIAAAPVGVQREYPQETGVRSLLDLFLTAS